MNKIIFYLFIFAVCFLLLSLIFWLYQEITHPLRITEICISYYKTDCQPVTVLR